MTTHSLNPLLALLLVALASCASGSTESVDGAASSTLATHTTERTIPMELGNFSVSLAVKDLAASRAFYEKLGFSQIGGEASQNWLILQNSTSTIGLFQGMFPNNLMTFNPGWDRASATLEQFQDVRDIQAALKAQGIEMNPEADPAGTGPASFVIVDPDGNAILVDQHVPRPSR